MRSFRPKLMVLAAAALLSCVEPGKARGQGEDVELPTNPPAEVAADSVRQLLFELAQLRQGQAVAASKQYRCLSAGHLFMQAAVAYQQANLPDAAMRSLSAGHRLTSHLTATMISPKEHAPISDQAISDDGQRLCRWSYLGAGDVWDLKRGVRIATFSFADEESKFKPATVTFLRDGRRAIVARGTNSYPALQVEMWELDPPKRISRFVCNEGWPMHKRVSPTGRTVVAIHCSQLIIANVDDLTDYTSIPIGRNERLRINTNEPWQESREHSFSMKGDRLLMSGRCEGGIAQIVVYDLIRRKEVFFRQWSQVSYVSPLRDDPWVDVGRVRWAPREDEIVIPTVTDKKASLIVHNIKTDRPVVSFPINYTKHGLTVNYAWDTRQPDQRLLVWNDGGPPKVWDYAGGKLICELPGGADNGRMRILDVPFHDGAYAMDGYGSLRFLWDEKGKLCGDSNLLQVHNQPLSVLEGVSRGRFADIHLATCNNLAVILDRGSTNVIHACENPGFGSAQFLQNGQKVLTALSMNASSDARMSLWDLTRAGQPRPRFRVQLGSLLAGVEADPQRNELVAFGGTAGIKTWDLATGQQRKHIESAKPVSGGQYLGQGELATWDEDGELSFWTLSDGTRRTWGTGGPQRQMLFDATAGWALAWNDDFVVQAWRLANQKRMATYEHPRTIAGGKLDGAAARSLTWSLDGTAICWDLRNNTELGRWKVPSPIADAATVDDAGLRLMTRGVDGRLSQWKPGQDEAVAACAFRDDGYERLEAAWNKALGRSVENRFLVRPGHASTLLVDRKAGRALTELRDGWGLFGDTVGANSYVFTADGERLLTWSHYGCAFMWGTRGMRLQKFVYDDLPAYKPKPSSGPGQKYPTAAGAAMIVRLVDRDRTLIAAGPSGEIAVWTVIDAPPSDPAVALLELEVRSTLKVDAQGNLRWLDYKELQDKTERLAALRQREPAAAPTARNETGEAER